jgi:TonB-linked SusC/RagA family outer membrane protein
MSRFQWWVVAPVIAAALIGASDVSGQGTVSGRVTDSLSRGPVPAARVIVVGTNRGASTDAEGQFRIPDVPAGTRTIRVLRIGYQAQERSVGVATGQVASVQVALAPAPLSLEGIVSVGYGTQTQRNVSGAVSTVTAEQIDIVGANSVNQMLEGKAPGLNLATRSAQPGGGVAVNIRGAISPRGNNTPLYVIDGVPITEYRSSVQGLIDADLGFFGGIDRDPLSYLNPDDIAAVTVLKDASAAAIYGSAASNGVVLITTKTGRVGNLQMAYRSTYTSQQSYGDVPLMNAQQFMQQQNRLAHDLYLYNNKLPPYGTASPTAVPAFVPLFTQAQMSSTAPGTNWLDLVTRNGGVTDNEVSVSGGTLSTRAYASFDDQLTRGQLRGSTLDKYAGRVNLDQTVGDRMHLRLNGVASRLSGNNASSGANSGGGEKYNMLQAAYAYAPTVPVLDASGNYSYSYYRVIMNPVAFLSIDDNSTTTRLFAAPSVDVDVTSSLKISGTASYDQESTARGFYLPRTVNTSTLAGGAAQKSDGTVSNNSAEAYATYDFNRGSHQVTAVAGAGYYNAGTEGDAVQGVGYFTDAFTYNNLAVASDNQRTRISSYKTERTKLSQFGRLNYTFRDKYILSGVVRRDGSSIFADNHKYGVFPGLSAAWIVSDESFMRRVPQLATLKLRLGYGVAGNESVLGTNTLDLYNPGYSFLVGSTLLNGVALSQIANPNLTWESDYTTDAGIDFELSNRRVSGSFDAFVKTAKNLLDFNALPSNNAVGRVADNVGSTQSKGFELALHTANLQQRWLTWASDLNVSRYSRDWRQRNPKVTLAPYIDAHDPIDEIYGWKTAGIIRSAADRPSYMPKANLGNLIFVDQNGDGKLDHNDVVKLGVSSPRWTIGFNNTFAIRSFDVTVFAYGALGFKRYNNFAPSVADLAQATSPSNTTTLAADVWSSDNLSGTRPGVAPNPYSSSNPTGTDFDLNDASYIRLRNVTLGYALPARLFASRVPFHGARVFLDMQNLALFTKYPGFDPELTEVNPYPKARLFSFGVQANY